ncbi:4,5-DOPA dioxygenase extradiol [uncultured Brevundimonas sp.]|uniref:4,5-DOPA-extradiol-dioxygenase n=1 Tax=uncultured Brevundimonas sp. TaxID=213418 RepID=UPI0030EB3C65|tara:strand:+ start:2174 stop:2932 length:759 start_codon:yes stop_codon:yes gene_type:complete
MTRQPAIFFGHGSPMNALGGPYAAAWRDLGRDLGKPAGMVMVSAHWETDGTAVTTQSNPKTIHDFSGFPPTLHAMQYPAPGSPALASRVSALTGARADTDWGLDHGTWSVLTHVWPEADVPVIQLSLDRRLDAAGHYELARLLRPLRDEGVIVAGSGDVVHNLRTWKRDGGTTYDWATRFNDRVRTALLEGDAATLIDWIDAGEDARLSVPTDEHYLPLLYVAAQRGPGDEVTVLTDVIEGGSISMTGFRIG